MLAFVIPAIFGVYIAFQGWLTHSKLLIAWGLMLVVASAWTAIRFRKKYGRSGQ